jgi:trehalose-phosphatase
MSRRDDDGRAGSGGVDAADAHDLALASPEEVAAALPPVAESVVLLDFDGTLSHLVDQPGAAAPADGAADAIRALAAHTRVVLVSGRSVGDLRPRLPDDLDVTFAGGHGAELAHGQGDVEPLVADLERVIDHRDAAIEKLRGIVGDVEGWVIEVKPTGVAVHYRMVADPAAHMDRVLAVLEAHAVADMEVTRGHAVVELRPAGVNKGVAVARLIDHDPRVPVAFGDDVTDEDTFAEVVARDGIAVLVATEPRETHASMRLADPDAVVATLAAWAATRE